MSRKKKSHLNEIQKKKKKQKKAKENIYIYE